MGSDNCQCQQKGSGGGLRQGKGKGAEPSLLAAAKHQVSLAVSKYDTITIPVLQRENNEFNFEP